MRTCVRKTSPITENELKNIALSLEGGHGVYHANISATNDPASVFWSSMLTDETYSRYAGIFEGGGGYKTGVWRSTEQSVMRSHYQTRQFNAWSRWMVYSNLMRIMGLPFSFEEFRSMDAKNLNATSVSAAFAPGLPENWTDRKPLEGDCIVIEESL